MAAKGFGALILLLAAQPALAQDASLGPPVSGERFQEITEGRTFSFDAEGLPDYGIEAFLPDRQVLWQDAGHCTTGHWYAQNGLICFEYDSTDPGPYCWAYHETGPVMIGIYEGEVGGDRVLMKPSLETVSCSVTPVS